MRISVKLMDLFIIDRIQTLCKFVDGKWVTCHMLLGEIDCLYYMAAWETYNLCFADVTLITWYCPCKYSPG